MNLYLRTWRAGKVKVVCPLKMGEGGGRITVFRDTPDAASLTFKNFEPAARPDIRPRPIPFNQELDYRLRQAFVRLTVDGQSDEFCAPCFTDDPEELLRLHRLKDNELHEFLKWHKRPRRFYHAVEGKGRTVVLGLEAQSFQLGYSVRLNKAWAKTDAGSRTKSFYASEIDLVPNMSQAELPPGVKGAAGR